MKGDPTEARNLVAAVRDLKHRLGGQSMSRQQVLAIATCIRGAHLLDDMVKTHELGATEAEASGLRGVLEAAIHGRYAMHSSDRDASRWSVGFDRRRKKFAEEFGRDPSEVDARPEEPGDKELPDLKGLADKVDELCPPEEGDMGARDVYDMLQGTMSDRHVHSGPGAVSRYIEGVEPVRFIDEPSPLIPPEDMLAMAFGALGQLYEEICHDVGLSPTDVATCER